MAEGSSQLRVCPVSLHEENNKTIPGILYRIYGFSDFRNHEFNIVPAEENSARTTHKKCLDFGFKIDKCKKLYPRSYRQNDLIQRTEKCCSPWRRPLSLVPHTEAVFLRPPWSVVSKASFGVIQCHPLRTWFSLSQISSNQDFNKVIVFPLIFPRSHRQWCNNHCPSSPACSHKCVYLAY